MQGLILKLTTRSVQFAVVFVLDILILYLLFRSKLFHRSGMWPPVKKQKL